MRSAQISTMMTGTITIIITIRTITPMDVRPGMTITMVATIAAQLLTDPMVAPAAGLPTTRAPVLTAAVHTDTDLLAAPTRELRTTPTPIAMQDV